MFKTPTEPAHTSSKTENGGTFTAPAVAVKEDQVDLELQKQVRLYNYIDIVFMRNILPKVSCIGMLSSKVGCTLFRNFLKSKIGV